MTAGKKVLTLLLVEAALLGGAFAGGYLHLQKTLQPKLTSCEQNGQQTKAFLSALTARGLVMEAIVAIIGGNPAYASDRLLRAQNLSRQAGLKLDNEFDEITSLILAQDASVRTRLFALADKLAKAPVVGPTLSGAAAAAPKDAPGPKDAPAPKDPAAAPKDPAAAAPKDAPKTPAEPAKAAADPGAGAAAAPAPAPAAATPPPAPAQAPPPSPATSKALEEGRRALLEAKMALIAGSSDTASLVQKLAQARVMLDEAGRAELDGELDGVIEAARKHEDDKVKGGLESVLKRLRP